MRSRTTVRTYSFQDLGLERDCTVRTIALTGSTCDALVISLFVINKFEACTETLRDMHRLAVLRVPLSYLRGHEFLGSYLHAFQ